MTWYSPDPPPELSIARARWPRVIWRLTVLAPLIYGGLALHLLLRLPERAFCGLRRPVTPWITQAVCLGAVRILGLRLHVGGTPMQGRGALVANHASWLDIFVLNAADRVYFVSKDDVASWPGIGWLAWATGTVFIRRHRHDALQQREIFETRLRLGHRLLFFPEGTSSDGLRVLDFKSTLFAAFFADSLKNDLRLQPVSLRYCPPAGADPRLYGWWGDMDFARHLLFILSQPASGEVRVLFHTPIPVTATRDRKALARHCERAVRAGFEESPAPSRAAVPSAAQAR